MIKRKIYNSVFSDDFGRQMRFITGPRQSGKTTLAKEFLAERKCLGLYYNWDKRDIKDRYLKQSNFFGSDLYNIENGVNDKWVCMDEIHKYPKWKNILKDFFDSAEEEYRFIVTGSARLNSFKKSGDSLAGRYFQFRLNPVTLSELSSTISSEKIPKTGNQLIKLILANSKYYESEFKQLFDNSGFPEPLLAGSQKFRNKWRNDYVDRIVTEDLRDLTRIKEVENISKLLMLLPERICSPLSINSLSRDMGLAHATIANYIAALELGYLVFKIMPYTKSIARSITKESKVYFYDWTRNVDDPKRFENFVALEFKAMVDMWTDMGEGVFDLRFIRDRDGKESDFVILKDDMPWLLAEVKSSKGGIDYHHKKNRLILGKNIPFVQIVKEAGITENPESGIYQISASRFFANL